MAVSMVKKGEEIGGNVLGVESEPQIWINMTTSWLNQSDDEEVSNDFLFMNDQEIIKGYGEKNVRFLKEVAKGYDPKGVFQKIGGFELLP
ncbi:hypothetical protein FN846DRAFT_172620 [Sphaerosporella brunnea]|uniref:Berberine/berberine-like domain-containing protein n=1 Tax=Sphaerosporella brunnea TaxID=1250544 RepID=A0A5J5EP92_9PEZI|nr:hypothetical protein FN846DRAFT_172620 [Sphaerosporella brunnea]